MKNAGDLHEALVDAGHEIEGCSVKFNKSEGKHVVQLRFKKGATNAKKSSAQTFADSYDWNDGSSEQKAKKAARAALITGLKSGTVSFDAETQRILAELLEGR